MRSSSRPPRTLLGIRCISKRSMLLPTSGNTNSPPRTRPGRSAMPFCAQRRRSWRIPHRCGTHRRRSSRDSCLTSAARCRAARIMRYPADTGAHHLTADSRTSPRCAGVSCARIDCRVETIRRMISVGIHATVFASICFRPCNAAITHNSRTLCTTAQILADDEATLQAISRQHFDLARLPSTAEQIQLKLGMLALCHEPSNGASCAKP